MRTRNGFSRIEGLLALGLTMVLVLLGSASMKGCGSDNKRQRSANNLLQWGIALNLYLIDNNNRLPVPGSEIPSPDEAEAWYNSLPLYISRPPMTQLAPGPFPEGTRESIWVNPRAVPQAESLPKGTYVFYYAMNRFLNGDQPDEPLRIYEVNNPTETVFLIEACSPLPFTDRANVFYGFGKQPPSPEASAHVLFCDGHVELVQKSQIDGGDLQWEPSER